MTADTAASERTGEQNGRPLNARSLALSVLLGSHPPALPARALVILAERFGIAPGTMRTALSRLVATGDVVLSDDSRGGWYELAGDLLERQRSQDAARHEPTSEWDGAWHIVVTADGQRELAARRRFRAVMGNHRFGELRPDIWMRPANTRVPTDPRWIVVTGDLEGHDPHDVVTRLWDLPKLAVRAGSLHERLGDLRATLDWTDSGSIPEVFTTAAEVVRFLRSEPQLPARLAPDHWPMSRLRRAYDQFEHDHLLLLHSFLRSVGNDS